MILYARVRACAGEGGRMEMIGSPAAGFRRGIGWARWWRHVGWMLDGWGMKKGDFSLWGKNVKWWKLTGMSANRGRIYQDQMIPNSIGYDPAGFSASDPLREERSGRRSYHSGRHRGMDGSIIKDSRQTTRALLKPRGAPGVGVTSSSRPSSAQLQSDAIGRGEMVRSIAYLDAKPGEAVYPAQVRNQAIAAQNVANRERVQPVAKPVAGPLAPRGMVPTMVETAGPTQDGSALKVPGFRPAKRLIDGKPAAEAIGEAQAKVSTLNTDGKPVNPQNLTAAAMSASNQGMTGASKAFASQAGRMEAQESINKLGIDEAAKQKLAKLKGMGPLQPIASL